MLQRYFMSLFHMAFLHKTENKLWSTILKNTETKKTWHTTANCT